MRWARALEQSSARPRPQRRGLHAIALVLPALLVACKSSSRDKGAARDELVVSTAGESPVRVARASAHHAHGKLRIVAKAGDTTQTRTYAVDADGSQIALASNGVTAARPGAAPVSAAVAALSLTLGAHGEVVAPAQAADEETANELRWLFAALPDAPIGKGARWRLEQHFASSVGPVTQQLDYQVVDRDADQLELHLEADAQTRSLGAFAHGNGMIIIPLGDAWRLPRASLSFSNAQATGTLEIAPVE